MTDQMMVKAAAKSLRINPVEKDKKPDRHKDGTVAEVNSDGSYQVLIDDEPLTPIKCEPGCTAGVGDQVLVCIMANGRCVAVSRLEGTEAVFAKPVAMQSTLDVSQRAYFEKGARLANNVNLVGLTTDGATRSLARVSANNNLVYGAGSYDYATNAAYYEGYDIYLNSSNAIYIKSPTAGLTNRAYGVNKVLWSGDSWPKADQTLTLSEAVSAQPNGIILVWCYNDYDGTGAATDYGWVFWPVPKSHVAKHNGKGVVCDGYNPTGNIHFIKYVYVSDTSIVGNAQNNVGTTNMNSGVTRNNQYATLRYVIGY